jgi:hypothetical protein
MVHARSGITPIPGRPSIDPELMIRMLIIGYCMGIRSERRLCEEVHLNLAYRCFCRLGLEGEMPITRRSRRTAMAGSATVTCCESCSRPRSCAASRRGWLAATALLRTRACEPCSLKLRYCPHTPARKIPRSIHEGARDLAREIATTDAYVVSRRERKKVEMLFAHLKRILKLNRLRLREPNGARDEFHLAAAAQNLRKLANLIPTLQPQPA